MGLLVPSAAATAGVVGGGDTRNVATDIFLTDLLLLIPTLQNSSLVVIIDSRKCEFIDAPNSSVLKMAVTLERKANVTCNST